MRFNGHYYLYVTSPGKGVHCWSSDNLASWSYVGMCTEEQTADGAWAPEVPFGKIEDARARHLTIKELQGNEP